VTFCKIYYPYILIGKDTSQMRLNDIIEELVNVIEQKDKSQAENRVTQN
jgi:hypothetical protein